MAFTPKLTYKGKPLVRKDNELYYGNMTDPYVLYLQITTTKPVGDQQVADKVHLMLLSTDTTKAPQERVMRQTTNDRPVQRFGHRQHLAAEGKRERLNPNANRKLLKGTAPAWSGPFFAVQIFCVMRSFVVYLS